MSLLSRMLLALGLCAVTARALAHAPLPRAVAVSPSGAAIALALPGFGVLLRSSSNSGVAYACDALLGVPPSDQAAALQYFDDETLVIGSAGGLRLAAADGCPLEEPDAVLAIAPIVAVAIHPDSQVAYVIAAGHADGVWRSMDRGRRWERRGSLEGTARVTGLAIDPSDSARLLVTRSDASAGSVLLISRDAGGSFSSHPQERELRVLAVRAEPPRVWAVARARDSVGNRGFDILAADDAGAAFRDMLRVNYFGGLTVSAEGTIWVGDEGGGIYRTAEAGERFAEVDASSRIACLASAADSVWACTPDLPAAPALKFLRDASAGLQPAIALTDVESLVTCPSRVDVASVCEAAWVEWQRDVLMRDLSTPDAGPTPSDDGGPEAVVARPTQSAGCAVAERPRDRSPASSGWMLAAVALALLLRRASNLGRRERVTS